MNEIFALHLNDELITAQSREKLWKEHSPRYGSYGAALHGWKPPKTFYSKENHAKAAIKHLPPQIRDSIEIVRYVPEKECLGSSVGRAVD
jgi:hypothetical protein